ncbi:MAG: DciA family protein [Acidimicrobiales bacterium]
MPWRPLPDPDGDPPVPLGAPLDRVLHSLGAPPTATLGELFGSWSDIVGSAIGGATSPESLEDGVLTVAVPDGGWASQLRWMAPDLVTKLNDRLGDGVVTRLEVRVRAR